MPVVQTDGWVDGQLYGQVKVTTNNCRNFSDSYINFVDTVILLQIVMVCPWTNLVKNHESQLKKKKKSPKLKMLGSLCNQTVNLKTDSQTLYYIILNLKYSSSIKAKTNMHC